MKQLKILLIPKSENPSSVSQFRPLGLCTAHYKILAKILVNRLRLLLQSFISLTQGAFMKGRQTTDLFLIAHETLHSMNASKSKKGWAILS